jgi:hypothetical protein
VDAALDATAAGCAHPVTALTAGLTRLGITRVYSDYGTCNLVSLRSGERVVCAVIQDDLHRGRDRCAPFRAMVDDDPHPAYVIREGSQMQRTLENRLRQHPAPIDEVCRSPGGGSTGRRRTSHPWTDRHPT